MSSSHCAWVGGEVSLHLSRIARRAKREEKDKVWRFSTGNCSSPSMIPNRAVKGFGFNLIFSTWESVWKISLKYLLRLEQDQYIWIREASAILHLTQYGLTSEYMEDSFAFEIWALCTTLNWIRQWRAHREVELTSLSMEIQVSSDRKTQVLLPCYSKLICRGTPKIQHHAV